MITPNIGTGIAIREPVGTVVKVRRLERERILHWLSLTSALLLSALLNIWNLAQNGYSNTYYSVAVQSMLQNFHNFFFASYDAGGFITVDKPPVALWLQAISAKIFGFNSLSLLLPEALAGVGSVALVYFLVKRVFGTLAAFVAAVAMAITPIAVAVWRGNNTDTLLVFTLLLAAWAISRATEKGKLALLALSMALVGVAFNIKMLEAFVVLPAFYLLYMVAAPIKWYKRILHLSLATVVLFGVAFSWATVVELTPADQRPWVGGSQTNSVFDLAFNYNGLGRITGQEGTGQGSNNSGRQVQGEAPSGTLPADGTQGTQGTQTAPDGTGGMQPPTGADGRGGTGSTGGMFGAGVAGPTRLFGSELASQWSWLLPLAGLGALATVFGLRRRKLLMGPRGQALLLWTGWLATYGVVFSMASGIFHTYYLIILAPAMAALAGIGIASMWRAYRKGGWQAWILPLALVVTAAWQVKVLNDYNNAQWSQWLVPVTIAGGVVSAVALVVARLVSARLPRRMAPGIVALGLLALIVAPLAWSITPALAAGNGTMPTSGPGNSSSQNGFGQGNRDGQSTINAPGGVSTNSGLISYLESNSSGYFYIVAVSSANQASSIALEMGLPVLATGGFSGSDPAMTAEKLAQMVANKQVRFVMGLGSGGGAGMGGGSAVSSSVSSWVQANCSAVDTGLYSGTTTGSTGGNAGGMNGNSQLYDCAAK